MNSNSFSVTVEKVQQLATLPSGSGIVVSGDSLFIVGDDATSIYSLSVDLQRTSKTPFVNSDTSLQRITKALKHDYEALTIGTINNQAYLFAFGSGSLSPFRDSLMMINLADLSVQKTIPLQLLYKKLEDNAGGKGTLNIEGAVITPTHLFLMNRGNNNIYQVSMADFNEFINKNGTYEVGNIAIHQLALSASNGIKAGISGGCLLNTEQILFTATLEDTPNAIDDGTVHGSYVGIINIKRSLEVSSIQLIRDKAGKILTDKIESIDILGQPVNGKIKAVAISDNDDGTSKLYELIISL